MLALTLVLAALGTSWVSIHQQPERVSAMRPESTRTISERTTPHNTKPAPSLPAEDVPGRDISDLPRYPGSVRAEYERKEQDLLVFTRVEYLSRAKLDVIRGFYRGVFRSEGWKVVNVEFSGGEWRFLVVRGEREADIEIEVLRRDLTRAGIELSEPLPEKEPAPEEIPQEPAPLPPSQSATPTPAPQSASPTPKPVAPAPRPAPTPDDYEEGGDDMDDGGDDDGGDD